MIPLAHNRSGAPVYNDTREEMALIFVRDFYCTLSCVLCASPPRFVAASLFNCILATTMGRAELNFYKPGRAVCLSWSADGDKADRAHQFVSNLLDLLRL